MIITTIKRGDSIEKIITGEISSEQQKQIEQLNTIEFGEEKWTFEEKEYNISTYQLEQYLKQYLND